MLCSISTFGIVLLFLIIGAFFAITALSVGRFFRPHRPTEEKMTTYECGEETIFGNWGKFNIRFYLIALIFVLFEVEIIFLFPWAKILTDTQLESIESNWQIYAFIEGLLFIFILVIGLAYLWKNNLLHWQLDGTTIQEKQRTNEETILQKKIPNKVYENINQRYN